MWSYESSVSKFVLWALALLLFFIVYQWISPAAYSTLLWIRMKCQKFGSRILDKFEEENTSAEFKQASIQTFSTPLSKQENNVTITRYNEDWYDSAHIFNLEQRAIFSKVCPISYSERFNS